MSAPSSFGQWLRQNRKGLDLTQAELALRAGCSKGTIRKLESGELRPSKQLAEILAEQLAIAPDERAAFVRFARAEGLSAEPDLPVHAYAPAPWRPPSRSKTNLPIALTSFVGRAQERAAVARLLATSRLLTLTGAGGIGKTRLALQVAAEAADDAPTGAGFSDGVWLAEFAQLLDPALVPQTIALALGVAEQSRRPLVATLADALRAKALLLLLDNCEHLLQAIAVVAETLLQACPRLKVLATSREPLGIPGEVTFAVPPLSTPGALMLSATPKLQPEAVQLFMERARSVQPEFQVSAETAPHIAAICMRLDGIPLAIELAAARLRSLSLEQIVSHLDDRFQLLTIGPRTALPRQQTLRATIDWSYELLSEPERALLRRLSVFAGGWTLDTAEAVCPDQSEVAPSTYLVLHRADVLDGLTRLVDKSLLTVGRQSGGTRYSMLETIRQYAREKLAEANEVERLRERHLEYFVALAEQAEPKLEGPEQQMWLNRLDLEHDDLRAAMDWAMASGNADAAFRLMSGIFWFWYYRSYWTEARQRLLALLAQPAMSPRTSARAYALYMGATFAWLLAMTDEADRLIEEAIDIASAVDDHKVLAWALLRKGAIMEAFGDYPNAEKYTEESLVLFRETGELYGAQMALTNRGIILMNLGKTLLARQSMEEGLALCRRLGNMSMLILGMTFLAPLILHLGDYAHARLLLDESLAVARTLGVKRGMAVALSNLGQVATAQGDYASARSALQESLTIYRGLGGAFLLADVPNGLSNLARLEGDLSSARAYAEEALTWVREIGDRNREAYALECLGQVALAQGDYAAARSLFDDCLAIRQKNVLKLEIPATLQALGDVSLLQADNAQARAHYEQSLALGREMDLKPIIAVSLRRLGYLELRAGNAERAEELFKESLQFNVERKLQIGLMRGLPTFAALALGRGHPQHAATLLGATEALLESLHARLEPADQAEYERTLDAARALLDPPTFARLWGEGRALTLEQAAAYALGEEP